MCINLKSYVFISISLMLFVLPHKINSQFYSLEDLWRNLTFTIAPISQDISGLNDFRIQINEKVNQIDSIIQKETHDLMDKVAIVEQTVTDLQTRVQQLETDYTPIFDRLNEIENRLATMESSQTATNTEIQAINAKLEGLAVGGLPKEILALPSRMAAVERNNLIWKKNFQVIKNTFQKSKNNNNNGLTGPIIVSG